MRTGKRKTPGQNWFEKLLEYKMYKYMSYELKDRQLDAGKVWFKGKTMPKEVAEYTPPVDYEQLIGKTSLSSLREVFESVMKRREDKIDPHSLKLRQNRKR